MKARFKIEGKAEVAFWVRAFQYEAAIEHAVQTIANDSRLKRAMVPIVSGYECGRFSWQLFIVAEVDQLGIFDGRGVIWLTDTRAEVEAQVEECANVSGEVIEQIRSGSGNVVEIETFVVPGTPKDL